MPSIVVFLKGAVQTVSDRLLERLVNAFWQQLACLFREARLDLAWATTALLRLTNAEGLALWIGGPDARVARTHVQVYNIQATSML
eukprot:4001452-Amphidinium_carterae.1